MKIILHLCADLGSDSRYYQLDPEYKVILVGEEMGVENYNPPENVHGIIANPVCTEFSTAKGFHKESDLEAGMFLVNHCLRIIKQANPLWWVLENPANGKLQDIIGYPKATYQPWQYGSPWTKKPGCGVILACPSLYTLNGRIALRTQLSTSDQVGQNQP